MRRCGFTLVEFVVVVIVIAILAGFALDRLLPPIGRAERAAFLQVQTQLRSALMLKAAERLTRGESARLSELAHANPMSLLLNAPPNYFGTANRRSDRSMPGASWCYDERAGTLVYLVGKHTRFQPITGPLDRVELAVEFIYTDRDGDDIYTPARDEFDGLRLASVHAYDWPD